MKSFLKFLMDIIFCVGEIPDSDKIIEKHKIILPEVQKVFKKHNLTLDEHEGCLENNGYYMKYEEETENISNFKGICAVEYYDNSNLNYLEYVVYKLNIDYSDSVKYAKDILVKISILCTKENYNSAKLNNSIIPELLYLLNDSTDYMSNIINFLESYYFLGGNDFLLIETDEFTLSVLADKYGFEIRMKVSYKK